MECEYCDRKFKYRKSFVNHMQVEHGISDAESEVDKEDKNTEKAINNQEVIDNGAIEQKPEGMFVIFLICKI